MRNVSEQELALQGLFLHLTRKGFKLSVRDYQDVLKALRAGFGLKSRSALIWLLESLWAHSEEEKRAIHLLFRQFPFPTSDEIERITFSQNKVSEAETIDESDISRTNGELQFQDQLQNNKTKTDLPNITFAPPTAREGSVVPPAVVHRTLDEPFILAPQPLVPLRSLIIIWRRFRTATRIGPKVELDLQATIADRCRRGFLVSPVLIPKRSNQAKLTVLIDVSSSMVAWEHFTNLVASSLHQNQSKLGQVAIYYFNNTPIDIIYEHETMTGPIEIRKALKMNPVSTLLILSDAGAARGFSLEDRVVDTHDFLTRVARNWQPIVWINPMPKSRWKGTSAEKICRLPSLIMLELSEDNLINAVDILRGLR